MTNDQAGVANLFVAPAPHLHTGTLTTRRMMIDVLIGLAPVAVASILVFRLWAVLQLAICIGAAVAAEVVFTLMRRRPLSIGDFSAVVTGAILAFSLPAVAPWYVGVIGAFVAISIGKVVFGGLGQNIFNPAMVGRAFVMIAFSTALAAASGYQLARPEASAATTQAATQAVAAEAGGSILPIPDVVTEATPLTAWKQNSETTKVWPLFLGTVNGSLGETSALACIIGGLYLVLRRTASWEIPLGVIGAAAAWAGVEMLVGRSDWTVLHSLLAGSLLFGAFFIATDPVSSPLTPKGKLAFGIGLGLLVMVIRRFSSWPEGVMFAVLLMNSVVPLINRWTIPRPVGGPTKTAKA